MQTMVARDATFEPAYSVDILGVRVSAVTIEETVRRTVCLLDQQGKSYICVTGVHGIMEARSHPELQQILNQSFLTVPDGMPTVWVGRLYGHRSMRRVYGPDLMLVLCDRMRAAGTRHFLYGGGPAVAGELKQALERRYPGLQIVGTYTPPFRPLNEAETDALRSQVAAARPHIVWVGLSTPKQERFMHDFLPLLETQVMIGVGAAFDIHTGRMKDAPSWMKQAGLQWLHRLLQEPRRLARRYLVNNPLFVVSIARQLLRDARARQLVRLAQARSKLF